MKKLVPILLTLALAAFLVACGPPDQNGASGGSDAEGGDSAAAAPTDVVLATPTPRPAPPTPMPRATPTPAQLESAEESDATNAEAETDTSDAEATEAEAEAPAETEAEASGPLYDDMVEIPAGPFTMGQDNSKPKNGPAHTVELPAYEIDRFEVTNEEFAHFVDQTGYVTYAEENSSKDWRDGAEGKPNHPVVYTTWDDAQAYCEWAGKRLPSEAEWEKAARGEAGLVYPWGDEFIATNGNFYEGGIRGTTAVGSFGDGASPYGVQDLAGNVREWTADYFLAYPGQAADADNFFGEENRVNRGGGWFDGEDGELVTTYNRNAGPPGTSANDDIGFRCVREISQ